MATGLQALFGAQNNSTVAPAPIKPTSSPVTADTFIPQFYSQSSNVFGMVSGVNPLLCATLPTALDLASILADLHPSIIALPPFGPGFLGGVGSVPWFILPDGTRLNVGSLAQCWCHGLPGNIAERNCRQDIANMVQYTDAQYAIGA